MTSTPTVEKPNRCWKDNSAQRYNLCNNNRDYQIYFELRGRINENVGDRVSFLVDEKWGGCFDPKNDGSYETAAALVQFFDSKMPDGPRFVWAPNDLQKAILVRDYLEKWATDDAICETEHEIASLTTRLETLTKRLARLRREKNEEGSVP